MKLTDKEYGKFMEQKEDIKNIFDILVLLYSFIEGKNKRRYRREYFKFLPQSSDY